MTVRGGEQSERAWSESCTSGDDTEELSEAGAEGLAEFIRFIFRMGSPVSTRESARKRTYNGQIVRYYNLLKAVSK